MTTQFFKTLYTDGCPTLQFGLLYTVMHCWKTVLSVAMYHPPLREMSRTFHWFLDTGMFQSLMRILTLSLDKKFLLIEYNRYVPHRILEIFFVALQVEMAPGDELIAKMTENTEESVATFSAILSGELTFYEQIIAQQVIGNFSCYPLGMIFLFEHPKLAALTGKFLWEAFDYLWVNHQQYNERKLHHSYHQLNTDIPLAPVGKVYLPGPNRSPELCVFAALCCMCNICAGYPDECGMDKVDDCLIALVKEGYYWHLGTICTGIHLSYTSDPELSIDKFLSLTSWSCFNHINQKVVLKQLRSLPSSRLEDPLMFYPRSKYKGRSVIAFLITHALWLDFNLGSHFAILGLIYLLKEIPKVAKAVVDAVGPLLVDLAHSIHHVKMPEDGDPMAVKRGLFEPILKIAGQPFFNERGEYVFCRTGEGWRREGGGSG